MIGIYSPGIWRIPHLEKFLAQPCQKLSLLRPVPQNVDAIAVWGHRPSAAKPVAIAKAAGKPVIRLEDGFVRSLDLGVNGEPPLSLVVDDCGIYYDASKPSALEKLVQDKAGNAALADQAREAMHTIVTGDLSKYNLAPAFVADESERADIVLVVDQTFNDMSVTYGNAGPHEFAAMLEAAM
ncbi:capsular polysaccharide biosynthesis protein, partial [Escherichia coli]|nr:capsular polysaccharide biosynthesis protein [Escherichia coli]